MREQQQRCASYSQCLQVPGKKLSDLQKKASCPSSFSWLLGQSVLQRCCKSSRQVVFSFFLIYWFLHMPTCLQYLDWSSIGLKIFRKPRASLLMELWSGSIFSGAFSGWALSPQHLAEGQARSCGPELPWEFLWKVLHFSSYFSLQGEVERLFCRKEQSQTPAVCDMQWASHLEGNGEPHEHGLHACPESHAVLGPAYSQT